MLKSLLSLSLLLLIVGCAPDITVIPESSTPDIIEDTIPDIIPDSTKDSLASIFVSFIDVGQGDCTLIRTNRKNVLIDAGEKSSGAAVRSFIASKNIDTIHIIIATHPHADHIGGLIHIIQNVPVVEVIDPGITYTTATYKEYLAAIGSKGITRTTGKAGMVRDLCETSVMRILHPVNPSTSDLNNASIVVRVTNGKNSFLFAGDAENDAEGQILQGGDTIMSTVLKVGHHGSSTSTSSAFLNAVKPEIAIIMCGTDNKYGHPHTQTLQKLTNLNVTIYRTDLHGTINFECNGLSVTRAD